MSPMTESNELALNFTEFFHNLGMWMLIDDIQDIGQFATPDHPSPFHHWLLGWIMKEVSLYIGQGLTVLDAWQKAGQELTQDFGNPLDSFNKIVEQQKQSFDNLMKSLPPLYKQ